MSFERKLIREQLKKLNGNNKIQKSWANYQLVKMTIFEYQEMHRKNKRKRK